MYTINELSKEIENAVVNLIDTDNGCYTLKFDDRLALCIGWADGYDENDEDLFHSTSDPKYVISAGIKVWTSDDLATDFEWFNSPYYADTCEVISNDMAITVGMDYEDLALHFIEDYKKYYSHLNLEKDGKIVAVDKEN